LYIFSNINRIVERRNASRAFILKVRDQLGDVRIDCRIILKQFREIGWEGTECIMCVRKEASGGICGHDNATLGCIKGSKT
jgi:hypothetical protein